MSNFQRKSERNAAVAAIGQGQLNQISHIADELDMINDRLDAIEKSSSQTSSGNADVVMDIQPVEYPASDAKTSEVRDSLIELIDRFNELLQVLKGGKDG